MKREGMEALKVEIEALNKEHQLHIMYIMNNHKIPISFNRNGAFINIGMVKDDIIAEIREYIDSLEQTI